MSVIVFPAGSESLIKEIRCTPHIEDGAGAVFVGEPLVSRDGRQALCHPWTPVDLDWVAAYTQGQGVQIRADDSLPADWQFPLRS